MAAVACVLFAAALGCMLAWRFGGLRGLAPRWAAALVVFGAGVPAGLGLTSTLYFLCRAAAPSWTWLPVGIEAAAFAALAYEAWRYSRTAVAAPAAAPGTFPWKPWVVAALLAGFAIATAGIAGSWESNPQGNWDAWSIWNTRAKFLASATPGRAWSPDIPMAHPEYPLLVPGAVARAWAYSGETAQAAPIAVSYLFFLALLAIGTGGLAIIRGPSLGLLFGFAMLATPTLLHEVAVQYADIPMACYMAGAVVLLLMDRPVAAGVFAGLAAWTKDEGLLFALVFAAAVAAFRRRAAVKAIAGLLPAAVLSIFYKLVLAAGTASLAGKASATLGQKLLDSGRYGTVFGSVAAEVLGMAAGWYHPVLPVIALAVLLGFQRAFRRDVLLSGSITAAMLMGYVAVYIVTPLDLQWHLQTSVTRLLAQIWPVFVLSVFAGLRTPESTAVLLQPHKAHRKRTAR